MVHIGTTTNGAPLRELPVAPLSALPRSGGAHARHVGQAVIVAFRSGEIPSRHAKAPFFEPIFTTSAARS